MPNSLLIHVLIDMVGTSEEKIEKRGMGEDRSCVLDQGVKMAGAFGQVVFLLWIIAHTALQCLHLGDRWGQTYFLNYGWWQGRNNSIKL